MDQLKAIFKYIASLFKSDWSIDDYPLRYREHAKTDPQAPRWVVQIINWWGMMGTGESREEAYGNLAERLRERRAAEGRLPRPGKTVPIAFASTKRVDRYADIAERFLCEVMGFASVSPVFISDESCLGDFCPGGSAEEYMEKIRQVFDVDVTDIESGNLADIFERIHRAR
ncbi:MAG TPA: hypothetical protein HPP77_04350 [Candidatus Hydrogenedentes bacterium]|nr:hypothetical protein [Candidatus Hydrogenedentota bacterium]HIJ73280.1 hypothetical protein [Candidatus Hydrogenedentota bacterium]